MIVAATLMLSLQGCGARFVAPMHLTFTILPHASPLFHSASLLPLHHHLDMYFYNMQRLPKGIYRTLKSSRL